MTTYTYGFDVDDERDSRLQQELLGEARHGLLHQQDVRLQRRDPTHAVTQELVLLHQPINNITQTLSHIRPQQLDYLVDGIAVPPKLHFRK